MSLAATCPMSLAPAELIAHRAYLLRSSMIQSLRDLEAVE